MTKEIIKLHAETNPYAFWTEKTDPATGLTVPGYGANTIFRFPKLVTLTAMEFDADISRPENIVVYP